MENTAKVTDGMDGEELDGPAVSALSRAIAEVKQCWSVIGWVTKNLLSRYSVFRKGTLSRWSQLYLHSLAPTKPNWVRVVGYSLFSLCVFHK
jgi:hypothetical protein